MLESVLIAECGFHRAPCEDRLTVTPAGKVSPAKARPGRTRRIGFESEPGPPKKPRLHIQRYSSIELGL